MDATPGGADRHRSGVGRCGGGWCREGTSAVGLATAEPSSAQGVRALLIPPMPWVPGTQTASAALLVPGSRERQGLDLWPTVPCDPKEGFAQAWEAEAWAPPLPEIGQREQRSPGRAPDSHLRPSGPGGWSSRRPHCPSAASARWRTPGAAGGCPPGPAG